MNSNNRNEADIEQEAFSIKDFLLLSLGYWKWFLASVIFFVGVGLFYVYKKQPVYERSEEILVKDQDSGGGVGDISNAFSSLGLFSSNTKVYNELISFTSPAVMIEVVERLNLTMNYNLRKGLRQQTLYGSTQPVFIEFPDLTENDNVGLRIKIAPDGKYIITKMYRLTPDGKEKLTGSVSGSVDGPAVKSPLGRIVVRSNDAYIPGAEEDLDKEIDVFKQSLQLAVEKYVAKLKGDLTDQDADVINLSIQDTSVQRADDILNMVVTVYNERWMADKNKVSTATSKFIADRLVLIEQELNNVDENIADQKSAMQLPDLEEAAKGYMQENFRMNEEQLKISNMLAMSKFLKDYMQNPENTYSIVPLNTGTENPVLENQIQKYDELLLARNNLAENSSDNNPVVSDLNRQLAGMRAAIMRSIDSHIANLQNTLANISSAQNSTKTQLGASPQQAKTLLTVERQQLVLQELYLFLLQKREENELSKSFMADNTRIITPPYGKAKPVAPKKSLFIIISFFFGIAIPGVALFLAESTNTKIRSKQDLENIPAPFVGEVPFTGNKKTIFNRLRSKKAKRHATDKPTVVVSEGKRDIPNEAFRVVRSNIDFMRAKDEKLVLALTSFNPGSGKSFIAYNLGASFALKGKKVLIIDGDLRHMSISGYVNSPRKGLATYLSGETDTWQNLVVPADGIKNLSVLPIGIKPPNPAELLDNGRIATVIEEAKEDYDVVLIDCPPINIVVDTQIINQYVNRTLFVVRAGLLEKKALADLAHLVENYKLKNISVLLNGTKPEHSTFNTYGNYEAIDKV